ncbi:MAG: hypothetical protein H7Y17_07485 [Chlorobia bacterium]|nr:hypothetical protein [Fimbriimonadaceae bacterium]
MRLLLAGISAALIAVGYFASQAAYKAGTAPEYSAKVDRPEIVFLSLALFLAAVGFAFLPDTKEISD